MSESKSTFSIEAWFALCGLVIGLAILVYRVGTSEQTRRPASADPAASSASRLPSTADEISSESENEALVTLGAVVTITRAASPSVESPAADPLLPPTSPEVNAILALKYYLLSDATTEAKELFHSIPHDSRDLVLRSALYAIWDRSDRDSSKGDWFMGETTDPYTWRVSAQGAGFDPVTHTDSLDATPAKVLGEFRCTLANKRIELVQELLKQADAKTQAYWMPYLVVKLRRMQSSGTESLMASLVKEGNAAIANSLRENAIVVTTKNRWSFASQAVNVAFPLILSALGFILAKISQTTLTAIDRWISSRWFKIDPTNPSPTNK